MGLCRFGVALQDRAAEFTAHRVRFYSRSVGVLIDRLGRAPCRESIVPPIVWPRNFWIHVTVASREKRKKKKRKNQVGILLGRSKNFPLFLSFSSGKNARKNFYYVRSYMQILSSKMKIRFGRIPRVFIFVERVKKVQIGIWKVWKLLVAKLRIFQSSDFHGCEMTCRFGRVRFSNVQSRGSSVIGILFLLVVRRLLYQRWRTGGSRLLPPLFWSLALSPPLHRPLHFVECRGHNTRIRYKFYVNCFLYYNC